MAGTLRKKSRRNIDDTSSEVDIPVISALDMDNPSSDIEIYSKEVLNTLIADNLPPTPNNFSLYFDRLLEDKSENLRKQIHSILELEENNDDENTIALEQSLKQGFSSIKGILGVTANLYKNMTLMTKILEKRKKDEKAVLLMVRTIARLLLKTSRRSDIVAHYGNGVFSMLLKHTDIESAKKASERLCELVSNSNFFLADREIQLKISIGVTDIDPEFSVEEIVVSALDGIEKAYELKNSDYAVSLRK